MTKQEVIKRLQDHIDSWNAELYDPAGLDTPAERMYTIGHNHGVKWAIKLIEQIEEEK